MLRDILCRGEEQLSGGRLAYAKSPSSSLSTKRSPAAEDLANVFLK